MANQLRLYVGDTTQDLADFACQHDPMAYAITGSNVDDEHSGTAYVSLGDLPDLSRFYHLLRRATTIVYHDRAHWSDGKTRTDMHGMAWLSENYIHIVRGLHNVQVEGLPDLPATGVGFTPERTTEDPRLWVGGCSTTFGVGVGKNERYANVLGDHLDMPLTVLARPGASISWACDQLCRSNIQPRDLVVLGITILPRFAWFHRGELSMIQLSYYRLNPEFEKVIPFSQLDSDQRLYESMAAIGRLENFCQKVSANLIMIGIHANINLSAQLANRNNFIFFHGRNGLDFDSEFLDLGDDQCHPGPKTHKSYAHAIINKLNDLGWYNHA